MFPVLASSKPTPMVHLLYAPLATARSSLKPRRERALENLALIKADRTCSVALQRPWPNWQGARFLVKP
jgi:hypothetical protein